MNRKNIKIAGMAAVGAAVAIFGMRYFSGSELRSHVLSGFKSAKLVKVIEHSSPFDRAQIANRGTYREKVYRAVDLNSAQILECKRAFPRVPYADTLMVSMCVFSPHHRLEITKQDGSVAIIEICFQCGQFSVDGGDVEQLPEVWNAPLRQFIKGLGLDIDVRVATDQKDGGLEKRP
jgi:hypothetical protein